MAQSWKAGLKEGVGVRRKTRGDSFSTRKDTVDFLERLLLIVLKLPQQSSSRFISRARETCEHKLNFV